MWVKRRKKERGEWKEKTSVWDDDDVCMCAHAHVCMCVCKCMSSVRMIAPSLEASGGHAQFQLVSLSKVHTLGLKKKQRWSGVLVNLISWEIVKIYHHLGMWWDIWRSCERNLSSCVQHVFQIRNFRKKHTDSPAHINAHFAHTWNRYTFTVKCRGTHAPQHYLVVVKSHHTHKIKHNHLSSMLTSTAGIVSKHSSICSEILSRLVWKLAPCNCQETVAESTSFLNPSHTSQQEWEGRGQI